MARLHCLLAWSVAFAFLAAAALGAAEPKKGQATAPAEKPKLQQSSDPFADDAKPAKRPAKTPKKPVGKEMKLAVGEAAINKALGKLTEVDFTETPLNDVIEYLRQCHHIEIKIDNRALSDAGVGADSPVTISLKGVSLRSVLNLMLRELSLTWMIKDEVLMITTPEEAGNDLITKVYDVADLVVCRDEHDAIADDYDSLIDLITATVKPTTWEGVGGPGSAAGKSLGTAKVLVVTQTRDVHDEITKLLAEIREVAKRTPNAGIPRRTRTEKTKPSVATGEGMKDGIPSSAAPKPPADTSAPVPHEQPKPPKEQKHDATKKASGGGPTLLVPPPNPDAAKSPAGVGMF
jgi:hypothetical protein